MKSRQNRARALKVSRGRVDLIILTVFAGIAIGEQARYVSDLTRRYTNEDQTLIWLAGRTWWRGSVPQPDFWGQSYGVTFEGIPAELVRRLGGGWGTSLLIALVAIHLLSWWLLGLAAMKRGLRLAGWAAFSAPILLTTRWSAAVGVYPTAFGRSVAVAAVAIAIWPVQRKWSPAVIIGLSGFAVLFDTSAVVMVAPLLIWCASQWRDSASRRTAAVGVISPALWFAYLMVFRLRHRDYELHYRPSIRPSARILRSNLSHPGKMFDVFGLDLLARWLVPIGLFLCIVVAVARLRDRTLILAAGALAAPTIFALASPHSESGADPSFYLMSARILFPLPFALWFVGVLVLDRQRNAPTPRHRNYSFAYAGLVVLVVATAVVRAATASDDYDQLITDARDLPEFPIRSTDSLVDLCHEVDRLATSSDTNVIVFPDDRPATYACAAIHPRLTTLQPRFDRRTWVLHDLATRPVESIIAWEMPCPSASDAFACSQIGVNSALIRFPPQSALDIVDKLGLTIRPFGKDCIPHAPETCHEWSSRFPLSAEGWSRFLDSTK